MANTPEQNPAEAAANVPASAGVVDPNFNPDEWVSVVLKGAKDMPPGLMPRAYFEGWGKDKGWTEVK